MPDCQGLWDGCEIILLIILCGYWRSYTDQDSSIGLDLNKIEDLSTDSTACPID